MFKREYYLEKLRPLKDKNIVKVLSGIRRGGKSTILNQFADELLDQGINEDNIIFINFESIDYQFIETGEELNSIISQKIKNKNEQYYLFFDEIQNVEDWQRSLASFNVEYNVDIYLAGSCEDLLSGGSVTYLTHNYVEIEVYPLSFNEIVEINNEYNLFNNKYQLFSNYIDYGGLPFIFSLNEEDKMRYLRDVYNSIVFEDILQRTKIKDIDLLNRLIRFMMFNIGKTFSASSISQYFKNQNRSVKSETIYNYLKAFENACFIHRVSREDVVGKKVLKTNEKFYLTDHGFRQALSGKNTEDMSHILENIVYMELLRRGYEVTIGKLYDKEIDFIAKKGSKKLYIQVDYRFVDGLTNLKELDSLLKIKDAYPKYVISMDSQYYSYEGVEKINILDFLEGDFY